MVFYMIVEINFGKQTSQMQIGLVTLILTNRLCIMFSKSALKLYLEVSRSNFQLVYLLLAYNIVQLLWQFRRLDSSNCY